MKKFTQFNFNHTKNTLRTKEFIKESVEIDEINDVSKFFSKLFESKEVAHIYHLQVKGDEGSYAKHMALGQYYQDILEMIDELIEVYQGQYSLVDNYEIINTKETTKTEPVKYFEDLGSFILNEKKCISEKDTHLHSLVDDIVCLVYKTVYKLKYNK